MHLGNAFAYLLAWLSARSADGEVVLRMEDLDTLRCTEEYAEGIRSWNGTGNHHPSTCERRRTKKRWKSYGRKPMCSPAGVPAAA